MYAKSAVAVALLAAAPIVNAGQAIIQNKCNFPVYLWTVSDFASPMTTIASGDSYSEGYQTNPNGGGVSMKLSTTPDLAGEVTQFEYTLTDTLWYDISNINGFPFMQWGISLVPSISSCRSVLCPAGVQLCSAAYNTPDENYATAACDTSANTLVQLCSGQNNANSPVAGATAAAGNVLDTSKSHKHIKHHHHHANPAPAPAPVPAPVASAVAPVAGALTTFVTQIVTVTARSASPTAA